MSLDLEQSRPAAHEGVEVHGWTRHEDVVRALRESAVLLLLRHFEGWQETTIPGKTYEYLASGNHILAIQQPQRELDGILRAYGNATILHDYQPQPVAEVLTDLYRRWQQGRLNLQSPRRSCSVSAAWQRLGSWRTCWIEPSNRPGGAASQTDP